jgi:hypothetical protein
MNIKPFILTTVIVATSIIASSLPSQAVTWDDGLRILREVLGNPAQSNSSLPSNGTNNEGGFNNDTSPPQTAPATQQKQPNRPAQQPNSQTLAVRCIHANGNNGERIDRDSADSTISVGRRPLRVSSRASLMFGSSYERTCKILRHPSSEKIRFGVAIPDNSDLTRARVSVYVAGQEKVSGILLAGQVRALTIDISGADSFAVVLKPLDGNGYIYPIELPPPL